MTTLLLLDTETNGLPRNRQAPYTMTDCWPAVLQLSWAEYTVSGKTLVAGTKRDIGVALAPEIPWDADAAKIHGISEVEGRCGTPATEALIELAAALRRCDVIVAHNMAFDKPVLRAAAYAEAARGGPATLRELWPSGKQEFCTMRETRDLLRLPSPNDPLGRWKSPRLNELYTWIYGHAYDISGASLHSARSDTHCLAQCIAGLLRKGSVVAEDYRLRVVLPATATPVDTNTG
jgi:DNA polymerase-3 subunit epsilon